MKKKSVPSVPKAEEDGNNEHPPQSALYKYDMVINNYTDDEYTKVCQVFQTICKKWIVAKEVGASGTPHLQCFLSLAKKERFTGLQKLPGLARGSFRACRNEKALEEYCRKDGNYVEGGYPKPIKIIQKLRPWQKEIEDIFLTEPDDRKIYWFWESEGGIGKSAFVKYMVVKHKCLFCDGGKKADLINLVFNQDMDICRAVIWDLPRCAEGNISYATLESVKNGLVCNTKYETGVKAFNPPHIFVFANFEPDNQEKLSKDRWLIKELDSCHHES